MSDLSDIVAGSVERLATGFQYTEGPLWHPDGYWLFVDTRPNLVYRLEPGGTPEVFREESGRTNGLTFDLQGRLLMCEGHGRRLSRMERDGTINTVAESFEGKRLNRPNDLVCHSDGSIYFTDPQPLVGEADRELGSSMVFRVAPDGTMDAVVTDAPYPNGLAFSPDEHVFYLVNSRDPKQVLAYDRADDGRLRDGRVFVDMSAATEEAIPDGMKVDIDGRVYSTGPGGLWVLDAAGAHLGTLQVPEPPTNCAFGGDDYGTMLITAWSSIYAVRLHARGVVPPGARALMGSSGTT